VFLERPVLLLLVVAIAVAVARAVSGDRSLHLAERLSLVQREWLGSLPSRWVALLIVSSAALSLLLELTLIRWQAAVFETFSFCNDFGLLACFAPPDQDKPSRWRPPECLVHRVVAQIGHRVHLMLREAFGGVPPVCISASYDGSVVFLERKNVPLTVDPRSRRRVWPR
jgi:hypothetical protein